MTWPVKSHWKFLRGLKLCVFVFVVSLELKIFNNSILFYNTEEKKKTCRSQNKLQALSANAAKAMCYTAFQVQVIQRQKAPHMEGCE